MKNLAESLVSSKLTDEHIDFVCELKNNKFQIYKIHAFLVSNVAYNKTGILNQIRAIPNVTVVTTVNYVSTKNMISVTENTELSIKFLIEHRDLEDELDQIEEEAATIEGVREFRFDRPTLKKIR